MRDYTEVVKALRVKAADKATSPAEAKACRDKADELEKNHNANVNTKIDIKALRKLWDESFLDHVNPWNDPDLDYLIPEEYRYGDE